MNKTKWLLLKNQSQNSMLNLDYVSDIVCDHVPGFSNVFIRMSYMNAQQAFTIYGGDNVDYANKIVELIAKFLYSDEIYLDLFHKLNEESKNE